MMLTIAMCSACGGTHSNLTVLPLSDEATDRPDDATHWTVCPETGVNIYIREEPETQLLIFDPTDGGA